MELQSSHKTLYVRSYQMKKNSPKASFVVSLLLVDNFIGTIFCPDLYRCYVKNVVKDEENSLLGIHKIKPYNIFSWCPWNSMNNGVMYDKL